MTTTTANMSLVKPDVQSTAGPTYATLVNAMMDLIDAHDHTTGKGVKVPVSGLNINADLSFLSGATNYSITDLGSTKYFNQPSTLSSSNVRAVYFSGGNLYINNSDGTAVQITDGAGLSLSSVGTIGGDFGQAGVTASANYSDSLKTFTWLQDTNNPAKISTGDILLGKAGETSPNVLTITNPASLAASFTITLPPAAATANQLLRQNNGNTGLGFVTFQGTTSKINVTHNANDITVNLPDNIQGAVGSASSPTYSFSGSATTGMYRGVTVNNLNFATAGVQRLNIDTTNVTSTLPFHAPNGSVGLPSISFDNAPSYGLYYDGTASMHIVNAGSTKISFTGGTVNFNSNCRGVDGSASLPTYGFSSDTDTGFYWESSTLKATVGGGERLAITNALVTTTVPIRAPAGDASNPSLSFTSDNDVGFYQFGTNTMGFSAGGVNRMSFSTESFSSTVKIRAPDGSASEPSFTFTNDDNTGMYRINTDLLGFATAGVVRCQLDNSGRWYVQGNGSNGVLYIEQDSTTQADEICNFETGAAESSGTIIYRVIAAGSPVGGLQVTGANTLALFSDSDPNLKDGIQPLGSQASFFRNMNLITYIQKGKSNRVIGFDGENMSVLDPDSCHRRRLKPGEYKGRKDVDRTKRYWQLAGWSPQLARICKFLQELDTRLAALESS